MGSSMKTSIFSDQIIGIIKTAKKNLEEKKSVISLSRSSTIGSTSMTIEERSPSNTSKRNLEYPSASLSRKLAGSASTWGSRIVRKVKHPSGKLEASTTTTTRSCTTIEEEASAASITTRMPIQEFNFPSGRLELLEVQKVVEEIIQSGGNSIAYNGDISFKLWRNQR